MFRDEWLPLMRAEGFRAVMTLAGPVDLERFREGTLHDWPMIYVADRPALVDAVEENAPSGPWLSGVFPLMRNSDACQWTSAEECATARERAVAGLGGPMTACTVHGPRPDAVAVEVGVWRGADDPCEACGEPVRTGAPCVALPIGGGWMPLHPRCARLLVPALAEEESGACACGADYAGPGARPALHGHGCPALKGGQ